MRTQERINFTRRMDKQMRIGEESNIINSIKQQTSKMKRREISTYLSIINLHGLDSPIKRHRLLDLKNKQDPTICCLQKRHLTVQRHTQSLKLMI
jgi:hypothetical protein